MRKRKDDGGAVVEVYSIQYNGECGGRWDGKKVYLYT